VDECELWYMIYMIYDMIYMIYDMINDMIYDMIYMINDMIYDMINDMIYDMWCDVIHMIIYDIWHTVTWHVVLPRVVEHALYIIKKWYMTWYIWYMIWYVIYLLNAIGLTPVGSSTVHIYTQTIHRTQTEYLDRNIHNKNST
jgi:hypothetical protein